MSYARAFSQIDTWITEYSLTANFGLTPVLEVWNKVNNRRDDRKEWARMLLKFGLTSLSAGIVSTGKYPDPRTDSTVSAYIYMFNTPSTDTIPENFDIEIYSLGFENLAGANIRVEYDKNRLEILSIIPGTIFEDINQAPIFFTEQNQANGWATITSSYLGGQTTSVGQEGSVAQLTFTSIVSGQSTLTFGLECEMVNPDDETIQINGFGQAVITAN